MTATRRHRPVVTLAALYGAGGSVVGPRVAERLDVPFLDRAIPDTVARQAGLPRDAVADVDDQPHSVMNRLVASLGRSTTVSGGTAGSAEHLDLQERAVRAHIEEFLARASVTGGVAVGRGGMVVLRSVPWALHVHLGGPPEGRLRQRMALEAIDRDTAARRQRAEDRTRMRYVRRAYGVDRDRPGHLRRADRGGQSRPRPGIGDRAGTDPSGHDARDHDMTTGTAATGTPDVAENAAPARLRRGQYLGYAAGDAANNLTFSLASAFLLIYYTDVAGIAAATAGTLFLIIRIWGGVTDLVAGRIADATSTRWGRFRPYVLFASIPLLLLNVALFTIPSGLSPGTKVIYAYLSYALFSLAYSFVNIPYGSLSAAMTQLPEERAKLSTARMVASSLAILLIAVVVSPQIQRAANLQTTLTVITVAFGVLGFVLYLVTFLTSRESVQRTAGKVSLGQTLAMLRVNRPLVVLCASTVLCLSGMFSLQTVGVYYARDVLNDASLYIALTVAQNLGMIVSALALPAIMAVVGKKGGFLAGGVVAAVGGAGLAVAPGALPWLAIAAFGVLGIGLGVTNTLIFAFQADTVDYGEWRSGVRAEGSSYAVLSFTRKAGQGVGGALAAYTIGIGGYVSGGSTQTDAAVTSIRVAAGAVPAALIIGAVLVMMAYPLTEAAFRGMVAETARRRAGEASAAADATDTAGSEPRGTAVDLGRTEGQGEG
jgi:glucuronide carrier protein